MEPELTEHEQRCLEHLRQARARGGPLTEYARTYGLSVRMLYDALPRLRKKGAMEWEVKPARGTKRRSEDAAGKEKSPFVAVRIEPGKARGESFSPIFRMKHVQGHVLEFVSWPSAAVMAVILAGERDDTP